MSKRKKKTNVDTLKGSFEPEVYKGLNALKGTHKFKVLYEPDELPFFIKKTYVPDFKIVFKDGREMYIEAKGYLRYEDRVKMVNVKEQHPDLDIRMIFMKDNKLDKRSKMRYSDWAKKYGFIFSIGSIPLEWFE